MRPSITILLSALAIVAATSALPPRTRGTSYPSTLYSLSSTQPDECNYVNIGTNSLNLTHLAISRQYGATPNAEVNLQFVDFLISPGSYGCQLVITDQAGQLTSKTTATQELHLRL
jgi:predicted transglutaminase-like cysteine proteinase